MVAKVALKQVSSKYFVIPYQFFVFRDIRKRISLKVKRNMSPPSSECEKEYSMKRFLLGLYFDPEDGSDMFYCSGSQPVVRVPWSTRRTGWGGTQK
jgi:hypothetical protein